MDGHVKYLIFLSEWGIVLAILILTLNSNSHLVLKFEVWKLTFENFLGFGDGGIEFSTVRFWTQRLASEDSFLLHLPDTEREAAVDNRNVLVIGVENIIWAPNWLKF